MTTTISLNRQALHSLIDSDPDFALSLKNSVLSEVGRRFFIKDSNRIIAEANPELFAKALKVVQENTDMVAAVSAALNAKTLKADGWQKRLTLSADGKQMVQDEVKAILSAEVKRVADDLREQIETLVKAELTSYDISAMVKSRVDRITKQHIDQQVASALMEKIAQINAVLK